MPLKKISALDYIYLSDLAGLNEIGEKGNLSTTIAFLDVL